MSVDRFLVWCLYVGLVCVVVLSFFSGFYFGNKDVENRREMFKSGVNGVYFHSEKYYCVWTKGRSLEDVKRTEAHEQIHSWIIENKSCGDVTYREHFCEYKKC